jgi:hypothetical protein
VALREQGRGYRIEGEVGRFSFVLYETVEAGQQRMCCEEAYFAKRQPREWHKTAGFREEAGCLKSSLSRSCHP